MAEVKIYDWNGTLVTVDGFRRWVRDTNLALAVRFYDSGQEERTAATQDIKKIFEYASNEGLYPVELFPGVAERLQQDQKEGYQRLVFSTISPDTLNKQAQALGIRDKIDQIIPLDDVLKYGNIVGAVKEDPRVYAHLVQMLGLEKAQAYTDDTPARAVAAAESRAFNKVYLFDPKNAAKPGEGYSVIDNIFKAAG